MPKQVNYSVEMTDKIISEYQSGISVDDIAQQSENLFALFVQNWFVREFIFLKKKDLKKGSRAN